MKKVLNGVLPLPPTPFTKDGKLDVESLKSVIDFELNSGCNGVGVLAGIGEGYLMSDKQWKEVAKISADHAKGKGPLLVGIAAMGTGKAIELLKEAEDLGYDAALTFNPLGFGPCSVEALKKHYSAICDAASNIQIVPYARNDDPIPVDVLKDLVDEGRINAMKYAYRSPDMLMQINKQLGDKLFLFCGADAFSLRYMLLGCKGIMDASAAICPKEHIELVSLVQKGKIKEATKIWYEKMVPWNDVGFYENWQIAHKVALKEMGIIKTYESPISQGPIRDTHVEEIKSVLRFLGKIK